MQVLLSPHNDDETLFAAYTLIREKPLVLIVTDSNLQLYRGTTAERRRTESRIACQHLGVQIDFLGLEDGKLTDAALVQRLESIDTPEWTHVYAPAIEGGHSDHDVVGRVASSLFTRVTYYSTYSKAGLSPVGQIPVIPTIEEIELKNKALDCYESQLSIYEVRRDHFDVVRGKPEFLNKSPFVQT